MNLALSKRSPTALRRFRPIVIAVSLLVMMAAPVWGQLAFENEKLLASDGKDDERFGSAISVSGDVAVIGARWSWGHDWVPGKAYIFRRDSVSGLWNEEAALVPSDGEKNDLFGDSAALFGDVALVGAAWDNDNGSHSGSAYVFRYDAASETWQEEAKLLPSDGGAGDRFGCSVALSADRALIGAYNYRWPSVYGAAYVFRYDGVSGTW